MPEPFDERLIVRYLLGQMAEDEETRFEDRVFADQDQVQTVRAVERDLIDEYARGELSESERKQFEQRFLNTPARRNRVAFARVFREAVDEPIAEKDLARQVATPCSPPRKSFLRFWRSRGWPRYALAGLAVLIVAAGAWLVTRSFQGTAPVAPQQANTQTPAPEPGVSPAQPPQPAQAGATPEQASNAQASPSPSAAETRPSQPSVVALALSPGLARGSQNLPQLIVPQGATSVRLRIGIEPEETYNEFRAELRSASGKPVKTQNALQARSTGAGRAIVWQVSSSLFDDGEYELALSGKSEQSQFEPVAYYYFKVLKK